MRGDGQARERTSSYDRGRQYSPYLTEKHGEGRNYNESDNGSERNYRKSVGDSEVSLHEFYKPTVHQVLFCTGFSFLAFNIN